MALLIKIKGATLMETLVATVLIIVIFVISSMILNNLFSNTIASNTRTIQAQLNKIEYLYLNEKIILPYDEEIGNWQISVEKNNPDNISIQALNRVTKKQIQRTRIAKTN